MGRYGGGADAIKRIEHDGGVFFAVNADALLGESDGKGGGVGAFLVATLNGVVGDEPGVAAAAFVLAAGVAPSVDVGFIGIRDTCGSALEWDVA